MARPKNRSSAVTLEVTIAGQTHAYLVKLATIGAVGASENNVASFLLTEAVERLMKERRAETVLATNDDEDAER